MKSFTDFQNYNGNIVQTMTDILGDFCQNLQGDIRQTISSKNSQSAEFEPVPPYFYVIEEYCNMIENS